MKLLVQGDDFGFTRGVTYGIIDSIDHGILRNTGLFANMPSAALAVSFMKARPHVCFGIDFNIVSGPCCADPVLIPQLVDHDGNFIRSSVRVKAPRYKSEEGRREMFPIEECYIEMKAQYERFIEMSGQKPGYLHSHSIGPEPYLETIQRLEQETGIFYSHTIRKQMNVGSIPYQRSSDGVPKKEFDAGGQLAKDKVQNVLDHSDLLLSYDIAAIGGHPGYVDADLLSLTTLSLERLRDAEMCMSPIIKQWIDDHNIELITYYDLKK